MVILPIQFTTDVIHVLLVRSLPVAAYVQSAHQEVIHPRTDHQYVHHVHVEPLLMPLEHSALNAALENSQMVGLHANHAHPEHTRLKVHAHVYRVRMAIILLLINLFVNHAQKVPTERMVNVSYVHLERSH